MRTRSRAQALAEAVEIELHADDRILEAVAPRRQRVQLADEAERFLAGHLHEALAAGVQEGIPLEAMASTRHVTPTAPRIDSSTPLPRKNEAGSPARRQRGAAEAAAHDRAERPRLARELSPSTGW